jgi:hypothetical protein
MKTYFYLYREVTPYIKTYNSRFVETFSRYEEAYAISLGDGVIGHYFGGKICYLSVIKLFKML